MRSNLQIYTVHELDFRCRQTEEHASVQIIHSFYKLCSPYFRDDLRRGRKANSVVWHNGLVMVRHPYSVNCCYLQ